MHCNRSWSHRILHAAGRKRCETCQLVSTGRYLRDPRGSTQRRNHRRLCEPAGRLDCPLPSELLYCVIPTIILRRLYTRRHKTVTPIGSSSCQRTVKKNLQRLRRLAMRYKLRIVHNYCMLGTKQSSCRLARRRCVAIFLPTFAVIGGRFGRY